ncbi:MAG: tRNA dihydrouridine synthase DusB [Candidatus Woesearchaeota archaeon]
MQIGNITLQNKFILSPMVSVTCGPFRKLCKEYGAALTTPEMISSEALIRDNETTSKMVDRMDNENPFCIQLFGSNPETIYQAALKLENSCDLIDVNLGCPAPPITNQGCGAALLEKPQFLKELFSKLTTINKPITAKMRLGVKSSQNCVKTAKLLEGCGIAALSVHGRTAVQNYTGKADYKAIREIKEALSIPVIGNGDVFKPEDAEKLFKETNCDGILLARGAIGNPFIFKQLIDYFETGAYQLPTNEEKIEAFLRFFEYAKDNQNLSTIKAHAAYFTKGIKGGAQIRSSLSKTKSTQEILEIFTPFVEQ